MSDSPSNKADGTKPAFDLDAALRAWPEGKGPEAQAEAIVARATNVSSALEATSISDDELFAAPLGATSEDGPAAASAGRRERDRQSLRELARMAPGLGAPAPIHPTPAAIPAGRPIEARKDDSGIVDLAAAAKSDPDAAERAKSTPLASHGLFDDAPAPPPASAPAPVAAVPTPLERRPIAAPARASSAPAEAARPVGRMQWLIGGAVSLSLAAALVLLMRPTANAPMASTVAPVATSSVATAAATTPPSATPAPVLAADPNALPSAARDERLALGAKTTTKGSGARKADGELAAKPAAAPRAADLGPSAAGNGDLGSAMKKEVGDDGREKVPAAALTGSGGTSVPQKPSQGAVTGAIGAVLPQARACLGPDDPVSRATIIFASSGAVQSVSVSGAAAGKPTESCIKDALSRAKVPGFAEPTSTANITIRHE